MIQTQRIAESLRASRKDPSRFSEVYAEHADPLIGYFMRRVFEVEVALDLMAETLARAFVHRRRFRGSTDAEAAGWIYTIAERELASFYRHDSVKKRALGRMRLERPAPVPDAETRRIELDALAELELQVRTHLDRLPSAQRDAIRLRFIEEADYAEVASALGVSEEAARARVARGLKALRGRINEEQAGADSPRFERVAGAVVKASRSGGNPA